MMGSPSVQEPLYFPEGHGNDLAVKMVVLLLKQCDLHQGILLHAASIH